MHDLPTAEPPPADERLSVVYSLRAIAAVWVLATTIIRTAWPLADFRGYSALLGVYPVAIFAVLSGFVLGLGVTGTGRPEMPDLKFFVAKRLLRFVPIVWATVLVTIALSALWIGDATGTVWDATLPLSASAAIVQMLFLPGLVTNAGPNPGVVGVALLVRCSIAFPFLVWVWRRVGAIALSAIGLALAVIPVLVDSPRLGPTVLAIGLFALGMGVAGVATEPGIVAAARRSAPWWLVSAAASVFALTAFFVFGNEWSIEHEAEVSIAIAVAAAAMVLHVIDNPFGIAARSTSFYTLRAVGVMSLSVCLAAGPVTQILWQLFCHRSGLSPGAVVVILTLGSPFVFAVAIEMAHWFERPCLAGRDREEFFAQIGVPPRAAVPAARPQATAPPVPTPLLLIADLSQSPPGYEVPAARRAAAPVALTPMAPAPVVAPSVVAPSVVTPLSGAPLAGAAPSGAGHPDAAPAIDLRSTRPTIIGIGSSELPPPPMRRPEPALVEVIDLRDGASGDEPNAAERTSVRELVSAGWAMASSTTLVASARAFPPPLPPPDPGSLLT